MGDGALTVWGFLKWRAAPLFPPPSTNVLLLGKRHRLGEQAVKIKQHTQQLDDVKKNHFASCGFTRKLFRGPGFQSGL